MTDDCTPIATFLISMFYAIIFYGYMYRCYIDDLHNTPHLIRKGIRE